MVISMHFDVFFKVGYFLGLQNFKYFWGMLEIPNIFGGEG